MSLPAYSVVIATYERPTELADTLAGLVAQTYPPERIIVVDASRGDEARGAACSSISRVQVLYLRAEAPSAACQRNQGAREASTPLIAFADDDLRVPLDLFAMLCAPFEQPASDMVGGVSGRILGMQHPVPKGLLRLYYRLQAGFDDPTYGGRLFGPAINCLPAYIESDGPLIRSDWLNSTCTVYRRDLFERYRFPEFDGYSPLEDVYLSSQIGRSHMLYFHRDAVYEHLDAPSRFKRAQREMTRTRLRHQRIVAREILKLREPALTAKLLLHRLFVTASILRQPGNAKCETLIGTWT